MDRPGTPNRRWNPPVKRPAWILLLLVLLGVPSAGAQPAKPAAEIRGEIARPGTYELGEGETLSSLILRAGGYTDNAWLPGAVLTRTARKSRQAEELAGIEQRLEMAARSAPSEEAEPGSARRLLDALRDLFPPGRVPVRLSHPRLMIHSPEDLPLEDGDTLFIPIAPRTVRVAGAVRAPGEVPASPGARLSLVAESAGGFLPEADRGGAILRKADGTARMLSEPPIVWSETAERWELSAFRKDRPRIEAGDAIFVPREPGKTPWPGGVDEYRRTILRILAPGAFVTPDPAGDGPFTFPSNSGLTGLLETPTARVMETNRYRLGVGIADPYRWYYGAIGIFPRLEAAGRITEVSGVPGFADFGGYGNYKDKAFDFKFQLLREGTYAPALSLAILDPHGTRIYSSQAILASKQIHPFDFSLGLGNGRLGNRPLSATGERFGVELLTDPKEWWKDASFFGGIQFAPTDRFALLAEYSPVAYHNQTTDPARDRYFRQPVPSRFNFGLRWKPLRWAELDLSWQRGNRFGASVSVAFDIGRPILPIYDPPYREPEAMRGNPTEERITEALARSGFRDIGVSFDGMMLRIEARNDRYFFPERAVDVILEILSGMEPARFEYIQVVLTEEGIPLLGFATTGHGLAGYGRGEIPAGRFREFSRFTLALGETAPLPVRHRRPLDWALRPSFETFLNDPSGFFKYRLGAAGQLRATPWRGGTLLLGLEGYPLNTVSTANVPLSIPVRSDIPLYKKERIAMGRLLAEQVIRAAGPWYGRIAAGYLEVMYAGVDGEAAVPLWNGRFLAGAGGSYLRKRDPDNVFGLKHDREYHTLFLNGRLNLPELDLVLDVKGGRFLAGDLGARFTLSKVVRGVVLSAWYSVTDTSAFTDPYNRGYHDKGIAVEIPIRLFLGRDSRTSYRIALSPWTRDAGQDIDRHRTLFDHIGRNLPVWLPGQLDMESPSGYKESR